MKTLIFICKWCIYLFLLFIEWKFIRYVRVEVLAGFVNALFLLFIGFFILSEAMEVRINIIRYLLVVMCYFISSFWWFVSTEYAYLPPNSLPSGNWNISLNINAAAYASKCILTFKFLLYVSIKVLSHLSKYKYVYSQNGQVLQHVNMCIKQIELWRNFVFCVWYFTCFSLQ